IPKRSHRRCSRSPVTTRGSTGSPAPSSSRSSSTGRRSSSTCRRKRSRRSRRRARSRPDMQGMELGHRDGKCSFESIIEKYQLRDPALGWLVFIYFRDRYEREPVSLIARLFLWGLAAGPWASGMNIVIAHLFSPLAAQAQKDGAPLVAATWLLVLVALSALNEEVMKYVVCSSRVR